MLRRSALTAAPLIGHRQSWAAAPRAAGRPSAWPAAALGRSAPLARAHRGPARLQARCQLPVLELAAAPPEVKDGDEDGVDGVERGCPLPPYLLRWGHPAP